VNVGFAKLSMLHPPLQRRQDRVSKLCA
jgi:hypothetical protein